MLASRKNKRGRIHRRRVELGSIISMDRYLIEPIKRGAEGSKFRKLSEVMMRRSLKLLVWSLGLSYREPVSLQISSSTYVIDE
jgi:hypothetical protein